MLYYTDKNWYHFIKEYLEQISKFAFQEVARPIWWPNRHILEILLACRHTLGAQNREASTEETWWHWFCIFHSSFFIDFCHSTNRNQICSVSEHVLSHRRNVASLTLFYRYYFGRCSSELTQLVPVHFSRERSTRYSDRLHDFSVTILDVTRMSMSTVSFLAQLDSGILCL